MILEDDTVIPYNIDYELFTNKFVPKDWEVIQIKDGAGKVCFAQSKPVLQSPKKSDREARLFVTFRPSDKISDEVLIS